MDLLKPKIPVDALIVEGTEPDDYSKDIAQNESIAVDTTMDQNELSNRFTSILGEIKREGAENRRVRIEQLEKQRNLYNAESVIHNAVIDPTSVEKEHVDHAIELVTGTAQVGNPLLEGLNHLSKEEERLHSLIKDVGVGDWVWEIGAGLIVPDYTKDLYDFTSALGISPSEYKTFIKEYRALPVGPEKDAMQDMIFDAAEEAFETPIARFAFLDAYLKEDYFWDYLGISADALQIVPIVGSLGKSVALGRAARNSAAARLMAAGDTELASKMLTEAVSNPDYAKNFNIADREINQWFDPLHMTTQTVAGLSDSLGREINKTVGVVVEDLLRVRSAEVATFDAMSEQFIDYQKTLKANTLGIDVNDIAVVDKTESGFTLQYQRGSQIVNDVQDIPINEIIKFNTNYGNGGVFKTELQTPVDYFFRFPSGKFAKQDHELLQTYSTLLDNQRAKVANLLTEAYNNAVAGLPKTIVNPEGITGKVSKLFGRPASPLEKINDILLEGDRTGRVFSVSELRAGNIGPNSVGLANDKEIAAYYALRKYYDILHSESNLMLYDRKRVRGYKSIRMSGGLLNAIPMATPDAVREFLGTKKVYAWNDATKTRVLVNPNNLDSTYYSGNVLSRLEELTDFTDSAGNVHSASMLIHHADRIAPLSKHQLAYNKGYVPRIHRNANWFVKIGDESSATKTLGRYATKAEADAARLRFARTDPNDPNSAINQDKLSKIATLHDREFTAIDKDIELGMMFSRGGNFTGARATHVIEDFTSVDRVNAFEALQKNIGFVARNKPVNVYREYLQSQWLNSVKVYEQASGKKLLVDNKDFFSPYTEKMSNILTDSNARALDSIRRYIQDQIRVPTATEQTIEAVMRNLAIGFDSLTATKIGRGSMQRAIHNSIMDLSHTDPTAALRSATFHMYLGMFNWSQLFVQAQTAVLVGSLYPKDFLGNVARYANLRKLMGYRQSTTNIVDMERFLMDRTNDVKLRQSFKNMTQLGLLDGIKMNADMSAAVKLGIGDGASFGRLLDNGTVAYREGEMTSRIFTYLQAELNVLRNTPNIRLVDGVPTGQQALVKIMEEMNHIGLNFSRANRAEWQKGWMGLPMQFNQVMFKHLGAILPESFGGKHGFTFNQKLLILLTQFSLYGSRSIPASTKLLQTVSNWTKDNVGDPDSEIVQVLNDGLVNYFLGGGPFLDLADPAVETRLSMFGNTDNTLFNILKGSPIQEEILGASKGLATDRGWEAAKATVAVLSSILDPQAGTWSATKYALSRYARIFSSTTNAQKAYIYHKVGLLYDKKGNPKDFDEQPEIMKAFWVALGFDTKDLKLERDANYMGSQYKLKEKDIANYLVDYFNYNMGVWGEDKQDFDNFAALLFEMNGIDTEYGRQAIMELATTRFNNKEDNSTKNILRYIDTQTKTNELGNTLSLPKGD